MLIKSGDDLISIIEVNAYSDWTHQRQTTVSVYKTLVNMLQLVYIVTFVFYRYKTTVSSAREKVSIVSTETDMARFDWLLFAYKLWRVDQIWL